MSGKIPSQMTFIEAKKLAEYQLSLLAKFAEYLDKAVPGGRFLPHIVNLRTLEQKVKQANARCLSDKEIQLLDDFRVYLITGHKHLEPRLRLFWKLYADITEALQKKTTSVGQYAPSRIVNLMAPVIVSTDDTAEPIVKSADRNVNNILAPVSLLFVHVIMTESLEYTMRTQLEEAIKTFNFQAANYDIAEMLSVDSKVKKGTEFRSDVRAIRDAVAHNQFKITLRNNDWTITIDNQQHGYNFKKTFTTNEFMIFFNRHMLLYKIQIHVLKILEIIPLLGTCLKK